MRAAYGTSYPVPGEQRADEQRGSLFQYNNAL